MRDVSEIIINRVVLNVLDMGNSNLVLANKELELTEETYEYFEQHILKVFKSDNAHPAKFEYEQNFVGDCTQEIFRNPDEFLLLSNKITSFLYKNMSFAEERTSGDLAICLIEGQRGKYLVLLNLDFSETYTHYFTNNEDKLEVLLSKSNAGLPGLNQKVHKAAIIREHNSSNEYDMLVIDNQADGYFNRGFLNCKLIKDSRENTKIIKNVTELFARRAFKDNANEAERFRSTVADILKDTEKIDISKITDIALNDELVKNDFKAILASEGICENIIPIDKEWVSKKLKRKRLKVDRNIELYIDSDCYKDKDKFQIKRNGDGTIDIILKNVRNYIEK